VSSLLHVASLRDTTLNHDQSSSAFASISHHQLSPRSVIISFRLDQSSSAFDSTCTNNREVDHVACTCRATCPGQDLTWTKVQGTATRGRSARTRQETSSCRGARPRTRCLDSQGAPCGRLWLRYACGKSLYHFHDGMQVAVIHAPDQ
jgi:hypothetical protein